MDEESDEKIESFRIGNSSRTQEHLRLSVDNEHLNFDSALSESQNLKIDFSKCKSTCKSVRIFPGLSQESRLRGLKRGDKEEEEEEENATEFRFRFLVVNNNKNNTKIINNRIRGDQISNVIHLNRSEKGKREKREPKNEILSRTISLFNIRYLSRIFLYLIFVWLILNAESRGVESVSIMKTRATALINLNKELTNNNRTLRKHGGDSGDSDVGKRVPGPTGEIGGDQWLDRRSRKHHHQHHRSHHHSHRHYKEQQQVQERQQKKQRKQNKTPVNKNCKEYDVTSRAFLSDIVFEGTARSRSRRAPGHYVTFVVKRVLKQKNNLLKPKTQIRLLFGGRRSRINPLHDCPLNSISNGHRVMANLKVGENYYVFADQVGLMNFTARGDPIVVNRRNLKSIRSVLSNKKERPPRVVGLNDLNLEVTQSLRLSCQVRGRPVPRINWYKDGASLIPSPNVNVTYYRRNSTVEIKSLELEDGGLYECRATSVTGKSAKISAHVNVWKLYTPTSDPGKSFPIRKCSVDAYCLNGGQCYFIEHMGEHSCECRAGFLGTRCEIKDVSSKGVRQSDKWLTQERLPH